MSSGIMPFGALPQFAGLSPDDLARLARSQQPASPSPVDGLLFDRAGMGGQGGFSGTSGTIVPPAVAARPEPEADAPAPRAMPAPPVRPLTFGSLPAPAPAAPATTGTVPASSASAAPTSPPSASEPSFLDRIGSNLRDVATDRDLLINLGIGLLSTPGWGQGAAVGLKGYQDSIPKRAAADLARAEFGLKARKAQQEQGVQNLTARAIMTKLPGTSAEDAVALAGNPDFVKSFLSGNYGAPEGYVRTSTGLVPVAGGPQDLGTLKARAQAQAEGTAAGAKDDVQVITRPDGSIVGVNKSRIGETDGPSALIPVAPATGGARVWGTIGADGRVIEPPPGTPAGTPGAYDEKGMPHVALTQGTNQLPQKANAELDQAAVKAITESRAKAEGAIGTIAAINRQKEALDRGIVAGAGANWRTQARAITAQVLGIPDSYVTNSQLFDQAATQKSAELAKAISQSGHTTNLDLQLGKTISSGDRSSVEAALRAGIEAQEILAKNTIAHHNASVDRFATPETAQRAGFFKVEQPEIYQYRPAAPDRAAVEAEMRRRGMIR